MPHFEVNGVRINYLESGQGVPIIQVHGYTGNLNNWAPTNAALNGGYRTVALDLRGHGRSSAPPEPESYSLDLLADDIYHLVRHLQLDSCYFMGHSMGGMLVQHLAVQYPELVRGLVLIGTTAEPPDPTRFQARRRLIEIAREQGMEAVFAAQLEMGLSQRLQDNPQLIEMWRKEFLLTSREAYIYCASAIARRPSLLAQLAALDVPALIVCGQHDDPFLEPSRRMAEHMPASRLVVMEGCNHAPHVEKPQEFNSLLLEFLSRTALSPSSS